MLHFINEEMRFRGILFLAWGHMKKVRIQILSQIFTFSVSSWNMNVLTLHLAWYAPPLETNKTKQNFLVRIYLFTYKNLIYPFTPKLAAAPSRLHCNVFPGSAAMYFTKVLISRLLWFIFLMCVKEKEGT